jgi:hypothetical protein
MGSALLLRNTFIWLGLFALGFANGALREVGIKRVIADPYAHHLSVLTAIVIFSIYVGALWNTTRIHKRSEALAIGLYWFVLTLLTETIVLNRWISQLSWDDIRETYNIAHAQLWPLVLIWIGVLPSLMRQWRGPASL